MTTTESAPAVLSTAVRSRPQGALVYYTLPQDAKDVSLTFLDAAGNEIRSFGPKPAKEEIEKEQEKYPSVQYVSTDAGLNRFVWYMRYADAEQLPVTLSPRKV